MAKEIRPLQRYNENTEQTEIFYPATTTDAIAHPTKRKSLTNVITDIEINAAAYDISYNHSGATYADLAAALGTNGVNVPEAVRRGGMSVKFIQSSDNKYVQYRLMSASFNTTVANWQGVDDEPTAGSNNLTKSGGVVTFIGQNIQNSSVLSCVPGTNFLQFELFRGTLTVGSTIAIKLETLNNTSIKRFRIATFGENQSWIFCTNYIYTTDEWVSADILNVGASNLYGIVINGGDITVGGNIKVSSVNSEDFDGTLNCEILSVKNSVIKINGDLAGINSDIINTNNKIDTFTDNKNLIDLTPDLTENGYIDGYGNIQPHVNYVVCTYDNLIFGDKLYLSITDHEPLVVAYCFYDDNGDKVIRSSTDGSGFTGNISVPIKAKSIKITKGVSETIIIRKVQENYIEGTDIFIRPNSVDNRMKFFANPLSIITQSAGLCSCLHNVAIIGDSLSSGYIYRNNIGVAEYEYSYGFRLSRFANINNLVVYASPGFTTKTWFESFPNSRGFGENGEKVDGSYFGTTSYDAYIIMLGVNDAKSQMSIGNINTDINLTDYTQNADTFAGNYAKIIQYIKTVNSLAKIFIITPPKIYAMNDSYNDIIRKIPSIFDNIFLLDFYKYLPSSDEVRDMYIENNHGTILGYQWFAYAVASYIDWVITTNYEKFNH